MAAGAAGGTGPEPGFGCVGHGRQGRAKRWKTAWWRVIAVVF